MHILAYFDILCIYSIDKHIMHISYICIYNILLHTKHIQHILHVYRSFW
jgi:hypothetical protein